MARVVVKVVVVASHLRHFALVAAKRLQESAHAAAPVPMDLRIRRRQELKKSD